ncbi:MAG: L-erythro-3,5-diaminohexanoate dehydrogenase, partial [Bacillota bacterium]
MKRGCKFGSHRVIKPQGVLPQAASLIDNDMTIYDNEILVDVQALNIDSASFAQLKQAHGCDAQAIGQAIMDIVNQRGKMQNPVTGSGGMLIGTVAAIGSKLADKIDLAVGDEIATLVSLSLTPLHIESIQRIHLDIDRVEIVGQAVLFESGIYAKLPSDMSRELALAALDVAGAPAQTAKLVRPGDRVLVIGASGKSGMLCCYEAMKRVGPTGQVIGLVRTEESRQQLQSLGLCHDYILGDATNSMLVYQMPAAPQLQRIHMILNKRAHQLGLLIAQP